jgi:hypothetical protein
MARLRKVAENDLTNAKLLLDRIDEASHDLKDIYYVLFENLNALFDSYPDLYKQIQMVVALPKNEDAAEIVQFHKDLHDILEHLKDEQYLQTYLKPNTPPEPSK